MTTTLAFDVYGTLIDPIDVSTKLSEYVGDKASQFALIWRDKQIEYLFRRGLMREYRDFSTCTRHMPSRTASPMISNTCSNMRASANTWMAL